MREDDIYKVVSQIVRTVTQVKTCVRANDTAEAPKGDYCSILVSESIDPTAKGEKRRKTDKDGLTVTTTVVIPVIYQITCNFYRNGAISKATQMIHCFRLPTINNALYLAGLGWLGSDPVQNLTDLQSGAMEERAAIVIRLVGEVEQSDTVNTIQKVPVRVLDEKDNELFKDQFSIKGN